MPAGRAFSKLADRLTADDLHLLAVAPAALGEGLQQRLSARLHADEVLLKLDEVAKGPIVDAVLDVSREDRRNNAAAVLIGLIDGRGAHRPISCNHKGRARSRTTIAVHGTSATSSKSRTACGGFLPHTCRTAAKRTNRDRPKRLMWIGWWAHQGSNLGPAD
jgi:hypothetical protein